MHREGHVGMALLVQAPVTFLLAAVGAPDLAFLSAAAAAGLAMAPDVDLRVPLVPHRGPTHTVWFALTVGVGLAALGFATGLSRGPLVALGLGALGFLTGGLAVLSHLLADALTPAGVAPLAPLDGTVHSLSVARASNPVANKLLLGVGVLVAALAFAAGEAVAGAVGTLLAP